MLERGGGMETRGTPWWKADMCMWLGAEQEVLQDPAWLRRGPGRKAACDRQVTAQKELAKSWEAGQKGNTDLGYHI